MRRLAAAFSNRDKTKKKDISPSPTLPLSTPSTSISASASEPTYSTCSSDQSGPSLPRTPEDDTAPPRVEKWRSWLSRPPSFRKSKPSRTDRYDPMPQPSLGDKERLTQLIHPVSLMPHGGINVNMRKPALAAIRAPSSTSTESEESASDSEDETLSSPPLTPSMHPPHAESIARAKESIRSFTATSLMLSSIPPPLLQLTHQSKTMFPRSSMSPATLPRPHPDLRRMVHKTAILRRIEQSNLTIQEEHSIAPFAELTKSLPSPPANLPEALSDARKLNLYSPGLRQWLQRSCYEERSLLWYLDEKGELKSRGIPGSSAAVAALEFSEGIEALAGLVQDPPVEDVQSSKVPVVLINPPPSASPSNVSSKGLPSLILKWPSSSTDISSASSSPSPATPPESASKRGVRFRTDVEELDDDDLIPLGLTLEVKRREREKRRAIRDAQERRRINEEAKERSSALDAEIRQRQYAEEVIAARQRREAQRLGYRAGPSADSTERIARPGRNGARINRPVYDKRNSSSSIEGSDGGVRSSSRGSSVSRSRPHSCASSGDDSHGYRPNRSSSASSVPAMAQGSRSSENLIADRKSQHYTTGDNPTRIKGGSSHSQRADIRSAAELPPVPFLARNWDIGDVPIPSQQLMQQGPFMASVRSQKEILRTSRSAERVDTTLLSASSSHSRPRNFRRATAHQDQANSYASSVPSFNRRGSAQPASLSSFHTSDQGRRGTVIF